MNAFRLKEVPDGHATRYIRRGFARSLRGRLTSGRLICLEVRLETPEIRRQGGLISLVDDGHLATEAEISSATVDVEMVLVAVCQAYPLAGRERERLRPPVTASETTAAIEPPPLVKLTVGVASAALSTPGIHFVSLYSKEADLRPELYRVAFDRLNLEAELRLRILTRRTTGLRVAAQGVPLSASARTRLEIETRTAAFFDRPLESASYLHIVDLEQLHKEAQFSEILQLWGQRPSSSVVMHGSREHPCLRGFFDELPRRPGWIAWGVNREQILRIDAAQNHRALHAIAKLSPGVFDPDALPERFHDLPVREIVPSQLRKSALASGRIWATIAGAYAIRDAARRATAVRDVIDLDEKLPKGFEEAKAEIIELTRMLRSSPGRSGFAGRWVDDIGYLLGFASRLTAPLPLYIKEVQQAQPSYYRSPLDVLRRIQADCEMPSGDASVMASVRTCALALISGYEDLFAAQRSAPGPRLERTLVEIERAAQERMRVGVVALNLPDRLAAEKYLKRWLTDSDLRVGTPPSGVTALEHAGISVIDLRTDVDENAFDVLIVPRYPSPTHLDRLLTSTVGRIRFVVPRGDHAGILYDVYRDVVRERRVYSPRVQSASLTRLLKFPSKVPTILDVQPSVPNEIERAVDEVGAARTAAAAHAFDVDRALRELTEQEASDARSHAILPAPMDPAAAWRVDFDDGSHDFLHPEDALQVVDLASEKSKLLVPRELEKGMVVITTSDSASSARFAAQIITTVSRVRPSIVPEVAIDRYWRDALKEYRISRGLTRAEVLTAAQRHGFTNEHPLSIRWYEERAVWRPAKKANLVALLEMLDAGKKGILEMAEQTWNASGRLRLVSGRVLAYVRQRAFVQGVEILDLAKGAVDIDPILVPEIGLRASHVDGLFLPKTISRITPPAEVS